MIDLNPFCASSHTAVCIITHNCPRSQLHGSAVVSFERVDLVITSSRRQLSTSIIDLIRVNDYAYLKMREVEAHGGYVRLKVGGILEMIDTK